MGTTFGAIAAAGMDVATLAARVLDAMERGLLLEQARLHEKYGGGSPDNPRVAVEKMRAAADAHHEEAQMLLGVHYAAGRGVAADRGQALKWYQKAARVGQPEAMVLWASSILAGRAGNDAKPEDAVRHLMDAAREQDDCARLLLGACHAHGVGVGRNDDEAQKWYRLASGGDSRASHSSRSKAIADCLKGDA